MCTKFENLMEKRGPILGWRILLNKYCIIRVQIYSFHLRCDDYECIMRGFATHHFSVHFHATL
jgi:hypothetical protein